MLDKFGSVYCNLYFIITQYDEHVDYQLPNEFICANFLIDPIEFKDPGLNAAIATVKS